MPSLRPGKCGPTLALDALIGLATLQAQVGEAEQACELAVCVLRHAASTEEAKDHAERLRAQLASRLGTPERVEEARASAEGVPFEETVKKVLRCSV